MKGFLTRSAPGKEGPGHDGEVLVEKKKNKKNTHDLRRGAEKKREARSKDGITTKSGPPSNQHWPSHKKKKHPKKGLGGAERGFAPLTKQKRLVLRKKKREEREKRRLPARSQPHQSVVSGGGGESSVPKRKDVNPCNLKETSQG